MNALKTTIEFWREGNLYIARSPELDMVAQGNSLEEARQNLLEVIEIQFEEMKELGTLEEFLLEAGYDLEGGVTGSKREIISFDKSFVNLSRV
ncbi:type II toxin-antitoxin system HicB family antitoxin [Dehalococcoidia bacterium]|nr:type II toxin-antitoxin system HicB family antitoxin [Dehalococcoidia bacterium]MCL0075323.1 type II toxin-antitoxin system HicB family antitoxin [Dehalococcoidia bacterium]MCL0080363.1 type II toxin-antitoxin system HicB family antitoxin [Dehalococcoidia bacterium]MCL0087891.1 type II toxin-antitoxin system HicB family antitoxin [Dehalococcoidia bacterium]MCL0088882.1 type II toxin-antitoxin system HicB family antitoxin [Dehalococcoidia bacterium]